MKGEGIKKKPLIDTNSMVSNRGKEVWKEIEKDKKEINGDGRRPQVE